MYLSYVCKTKLSWAVVCLLILTAGSKAALGQASFQGIGDLSGGIFKSESFDVSDNSTVVGLSYGSAWKAFSWSLETDIVDLGAGSFSLAYAISSDGSVIAGRYRSLTVNGYEAFRWSQNSGIVGMGFLPGDESSSAAWGVSGDGNTIVGNSGVSSGKQAFRWTKEEGMVGIGDLSGGQFSSTAQDASFNGSVIVGQGNSSFGWEAFRWKENTGMVGLGDLPGSGFYSVATSVSDDGLVAIGYSDSSLGREAFRWEKDVISGLGIISDKDFSRALGTNFNGDIVVGSSGNGTLSSPSNEVAFIWDETNGMRLLQDVLTVEYGVDLDGWTLTTASSISQNGLIITGTGIDPYDNTQAWITTIPEPATLSLLALGSAVMLRRRRRSS